MTHMAHSAFKAIASAAGGASLGVSYTYFYYGTARAVSD
jgi:hypothetical protein